MNMHPPNRFDDEELQREAKRVARRGSTAVMLVSLTVMSTASVYFLAVVGLFVAPMPPAVLIVVGLFVVFCVAAMVLHVRRVRSERLTQEEIRDEAHQIASEPLPWTVKGTLSSLAFRSPLYLLASIAVHQIFTPRATIPYLTVVVLLQVLGPVIRREAAREFTAPLADVLARARAGKQQNEDAS